MKNTMKNKMVLLIIMGIGFTGLYFGTIQPRLSIITDVSASGMENSKVQMEPYDAYIADYSEHPTLDCMQFTIKILLDVRNPYNDRNIIVPRFDVDLFNLDKPLGRIWTMEEFRLDPFIDENSKAAGLLPIYFSLYIGGKDSGFANFMSGLLIGEIGTLRLDATVDIGDLSFNVKSFLGEVLGILGMEDGDNEMDVGTVLADLLGGNLGSIDPIAHNHYILLRNDSFVKDIRALFYGENVTIFRNENQSLYIGANEPFEKYWWQNATMGNNAVGDGNYSWEYYSSEGWKELTVNDGTNAFTQNGSISWDNAPGWQTLSVVDFFSNPYYYVRCNVIDLDSGIDLQSENQTFIRMNTYLSKIGEAPVIIPPDPDEPEPEPEPEMNYPDLPDSIIPEEPGLLQYGDFDEYLDSCGVNLDEFIEIFILGAGDIGIPTGLPVGFDKIEKTPWISITEEEQSESSEIASILFTLFRFLGSHNINTGQFLIMCEIQWDMGIDYLGSNFGNFSTNELGIDIYTGQNIYIDYNDSDGFQSTVAASTIFMGFLVASAVVAIPIGMRKKDQTLFLSKNDIVNVSEVMENKKSKYTKLSASIPEDQKLKRNWELLAGISSIAIGVGLYFLKQAAMTGWNDSNIYNFLPELLQGVFININNTSASNPYAPITIVLIAFIDFPSCLAWIIPSFIVAKKRNEQFSNLKQKKAGWEVFWKGAYVIAAAFVLTTFGMIVGLIIQQISGPSEVLTARMSFLSGASLLVLLIFLSPYFWLGLLGSMIGGYIGTKSGLKNPGKVEVKFEEVYDSDKTIEKHYSESDFTDKSEEWDDSEEDNLGWGDSEDDIETLDEMIKQGDSTIKINVGVAQPVKISSEKPVLEKLICKKCWTTFEKDKNECNLCGNKELVAAERCPNCQEFIPEDARFCNKCGHRKY